MPVKLNIGLSRKVGEANFGSRGASLHLEVELDSSVLLNADQLRERVHELYQFARQSVDEELQGPADKDVSQSSVGPINRISEQMGQGSGMIPNDPRSPETRSMARNGSAANGHHTDPPNSVGHAAATPSANGQHRTVEVARASAGQIRAIVAICKRQGRDPNVLIRERFRIYRMDSLTMREASCLIDELQSPASVRN